MQSSCDTEQEIVRHKAGLMKKIENTVNDLETSHSRSELKKIYLSGNYPMQTVFIEEPPARKKSLKNKKYITRKSCRTRDVSPLVSPPPSILN
jgi:hypothetical protein